MVDFLSSYDDCNNNFDSGKIVSNIMMSLKDMKKQPINSIHKKIKIVDLITLLSTLICSILSVTAIEESLYFISFDPTEDISHNICANFNYTEKVNATQVSQGNISLFSLIPCFKENDNLVNIFRMIITTFTVIVIIMLILRYLLLVRFNKLRVYLKSNETLWTSGYMKYLIAEIFLNLIHPIPFHTSSISISQRTNKRDAYVDTCLILTILSLFFRSYHIFKYFSFHSRWYSYETEKLCLQSETTLDSVFTIKAEFKEKPFILVGVTMLISIFIFGYSLRSVEMFFMATSGFDWRYYWNGMWCIIITMATVGFGDFFPVSIMGRIIAIISCFWGTFLISLMVAAMTVAVEFNSQEAIAYDSIKAAYFEIEYGTQATILIQTAFRYRSLLKTIDTSNEKGLSYLLKKKSLLFQKLKSNLENFRKMKKSKNDSLEAMLIELSISKIEENLTIEMDKIKNQLYVIDDIKQLLEEYSDNQEKIKEKNLSIYKDLQEICYIKSKFKY